MKCFRCGSNDVVADPLVWGPDPYARCDGCLQNNWNSAAEHHLEPAEGETPLPELAVPDVPLYDLGSRGTAAPEESP